MATVGEFTASNINFDQDKREEEEKQKKSQLDLEQFKTDVAANTQLAQQGQLHQALEGLLNLERTARLAEDITGTKMACAAIVDACHAAKEWKLLEEHVVLLAKRRGQLKQVIQAFVRQAMGYIDTAPDKETRVSLIKTLQTVTEGKIFVEIERARLTRRLAAIKEAEGAIAEAADILQEVPVETFGAMAKTEKIAFILEQVRLCLAREDYMRAQILSRKIAPKTFASIRKGEGKGEIGIEGTAIEAPEDGIPSLPELKLRYYGLMIQYHLHSHNYLEVCRAYRAVYESEGVKEEQDKWEPVLKKICWYAVLSPTYSTAEGSSSDALTLLTTTAADKRLASELPLYKQLLTTFQNKEIIRWAVFEAQYGAEMDAMGDVFGPSASGGAAATPAPSAAAAAGGAKAAQLAGGALARRNLKLRVIEHNILVVARYYTRISIARLAELLDLSPAEAEKQLSELVVAKAILAKIDRPAGVVTLTAHGSAADVLNQWSSNIGRLLDLVEKSCQQIQKEAMVHKVSLGVAA